MKEKLRIAFIDFVLDPSRPGRSGLSDLAWDTARSVKRLGNEVHIIGPYSVNSFPDPDVHVHRFTLPFPGYQNIFGHFRIVMRARQILHSLGRFDLIHTPEYFSGAILASLDPGTPLVFTEPGNIYERLSMPNGNPYDWSTTQVYKICARRIARRCAHLIATSDTMVKWWHWTGIPFNKITKIPLGVDTDLFKPIENAKQELGFPNSTPLVIYAARLSPENGPEISLRAFNLVHQHIPDAHLGIVGAGIEEARLKEMASNLGIQDNITWYGWVNFEKLPLYYSAADAFTFSGFTGGTPRVLLQAMACGAPVIGSAIGGITDHIQDGKTGILSPAGSDENLAFCLIRLLQDRQYAATLAHNGRSYVANQLAWRVLAQKIQQVYQSVISAN